MQVHVYSEKQKSVFSVLKESISSIYKHKKTFFECQVIWTWSDNQRTFKDQIVHIYEFTILFFFVNGNYNVFYQSDFVIYIFCEC